jgi:hypothetical protein
MSLIERYIYAVTQDMPEDQRDDVADELRGIIEDSLDDKGSRSKKHIKEVLIAMGDPTSLAYRYKGTNQYLIGPDLYGVYVRALKLTLSIGLPIGSIISLIAHITQQPESIIGLIVSVVGTICAIGIQILFWVTLIFFIFEKTNVKEKDLNKNNAWTPEMLPEITSKRQIPIFESVSDIVWYCLLILLPFIAQPLVGVHLDGQVTPIFNPQILSIWIPIALTFGVIGLMKSILKLQLRNWTRGLTIFNVLFALAMSVALAVLPFTTQFINPAFMTLLDTYITTSNLAEITAAANWTAAIVIVIVIFAYLYDAVNSIRLMRKLK